jgi:hypothetical protein
MYFGIPFSMLMCECGAASAHAPSNACLCSYTYASIFWMSSDAIVKLKDN